LTLEELNRCAKFRSRNRFPTLIYYHQKQNGEAATLWRCSQCESGISKTRNNEDEMVIRMIGNPLQFKPSNEQQNVNVHIYDARPYLNAFANKMKGKGYEDTDYYKNAEIQFLDIGNIHVIRESYSKISKFGMKMLAQKTE